MYRFFSEHNFLFLLDKYLRMELLNHTVSVDLALPESVNSFPKWWYPPAFPSVMYESFSCFTSSLAFSIGF